MDKVFYDELNNVSLYANDPKYQEIINKETQDKNRLKNMLNSKAITKELYDAGIEQINQETSKKLTDYKNNYFLNNEDVQRSIYNSKHSIVQNPESVGNIPESNKSNKTQENSFEDWQKENVIPKQEAMYNQDALDLFNEYNRGEITPQEYEAKKQKLVTNANVNVSDKQKKSTSKQIAKNEKERASRIKKDTKAYYNDNVYNKLQNDYQTGKIDAKAYNDQMRAKELEKYQSMFDSGAIDQKQFDHMKKIISNKRYDYYFTDANLEKTKQKAKSIFNDNSSNSNLNPLYDSLNQLGRTFAVANAKNPMSKHFNREAELHEQQAADIQKTQQQEQQIANRNYRVEADKNAAAQAAAENAQSINNLGATAGGATAALNRNVKASDYNTHMNRQDTARSKAAEYRDEAYNAKQVAEDERSTSTALNSMEQQRRIQNNAVDDLASGNIDTTGADTKEQGNVVEDEPKEITIEQKREARNTLAIMQTAINMLDESNKFYTADGDVIYDEAEWRKNNPDLASQVDSLVNSNKNSSSTLAKDLDEYRQNIVRTFNLNLPDIANGERYPIPELIKTIKNSEYTEPPMDTVTDTVQETPKQPDVPSDRRIKNIVRCLSNIKY